LGQSYLRSLAIKNIAVSKKEVFAYYNEEISGFRRTKNKAKIYHLYTKKKSDAEEHIQTLSSAGKKNEKNDLFLKLKIQPSIVSNGELIPELNNVIFHKKSKKRLHGPIKSKRGYHVLFIIERFEAGTVAPIEEVYDEIYQRVFQKKYALKSLHILDSLLNHTPYI
jgi:parvulin-like peptidyl-prolyl isomerase